MITLCDQAHFTSSKCVKEKASLFSEQGQLWLPCKLNHQFSTITNKKSENCFMHSVGSDVRHSFHGKNSVHDVVRPLLLVVVGSFLLLQCFSGNISVPAQGADNETAFFNLKVAVYETIGKSCDALDDVPMQMTEEIKLKVNFDIRLNEVTWRRNTHIYGSYFDSTHRENVAKVK